MQISRLAKENLKLDSRVLGRRWKETYNGFFSDPAHIEEFVESCLGYLPDRPRLKILYVASASGLLGEALASRLEGAGREAELTLLDVSRKQLEENRNSRTRKLCADLLTVEISEKFDVILMRSSMDYFPDEQLQVALLRRIGKWLEDGGVFINQPASLRSNEARDVADEVYRSNNRMARRHFQSMVDIGEIYAKAGMRARKILDGPELTLGEADHRERYGIGDGDVKRIQKIIKLHNVEGLSATPSGYRIAFTFPIYVATRELIK